MTTRQSEVSAARATWATQGVDGSGPNEGQAWAARQLAFERLLLELERRASLAPPRSQKA